MAQKLNVDTSIVDLLKSKGIDSSYSNRKKIASEYGISNYSGTYAQNVQLLNAYKNGSIGSTTSATETAAAATTGTSTGASTTATSTSTATPTTTIAETKADIANQALETQNDLITQSYDTQVEARTDAAEAEIAALQTGKTEADAIAEAEISDANVDYTKATDAYGANAESRAEQGLGGSGFAETTKNRMYNSLQVRTSNAKAALQSAYTQYNESIATAITEANTDIASYANEMFKSQIESVLTEMGVKIDILDDAQAQANWETEYNRDVIESDREYALDVAEANSSTSSGSSDLFGGSTGSTGTTNTVPVSVDTTGTPIEYTGKSLYGGKYKSTTTTLGHILSDTQFNQLDSMIKGEAQYGGSGLNKDMTVYVDSKGYAYILGGTLEKNYMVSLKELGVSSLNVDGSF